MITFPKIKIASYAIYKRLQGYHLLKNSKNTPQTEINMIKTIHDGIDKTGLRTTINSKIIITSDEFGNNNIETRNIHSHRIYDFENKKFSKAENVVLWIYKDNKIKSIERDNYTYWQLNKLPEHSTKEMTEILKQINNFKENTKSNKQNFFKVLCQNLTNKE